MNKIEHKYSHFILEIQNTFNEHIFTYVKDEKIISPSSLLMLIPTTIVTIGGYFIANGLMYDFGAAIAELPTCWLQPGVGALIYIVVGIGLDKINFKKKLSL